MRRTSLPTLGAREMGGTVWRGALVLVGLVSLACQEEPSPPVQAAPAPVPTPAPSPPAPVITGMPPIPIPVGIPLAIVPGKGVGPVRFGARLDTVERLMGVPCDEQRPLGAAAASGGAGGAPPDVLCRYSAHAVEFELHGGVVTRIFIHRMDRPFSADGSRKFGIFNGRFLEGPAPGMFVNVVQSELGKPRHVEKKDGSGPYHTEEVHEYKGGLSLEYDRLPNNNLVLGGVILSKPPA